MYDFRFKKNLSLSYEIIPSIEWLQQIARSANARTKIDGRILLIRLTPVPQTELIPQRLTYPHKLDPFSATSDSMKY